MTLDGFTWLGIFAGLFLFLCFCAYLIEAVGDDPISDRRYQAHPRDSGDPFTARPSAPSLGGVGLDGSPDLRERVTGR